LTYAELYEWIEDNYDFDGWDDYGEMNDQINEDWDGRGSFDDIISFDEFINNYEGN